MNSQLNNDINPNNLPSTCPPNKPARQRHFLLRQSDEKWAEEVAQYETNLLTWKRELNLVLTQAAEDGTLTAKMIIEAVEREARIDPDEMRKCFGDAWYEQFPSALWVMENQETFGRLDSASRTEVIVHLVAEEQYYGNIRSRMLSRYSEMFLLIEDIEVRWRAIADAVYNEPSYNEWSWMKNLAEHHDHARLRDLVLTLVRTLPAEQPRGYGVVGNPQYATQAVEGVRWEIYKTDPQAFLEMLTVLAQRVPAFILDWWKMLVIEIGELFGCKPVDNKRHLALQQQAVNHVEMHMPFGDIADQMHDIQERNDRRAYKAGVEHAGGLLETVIEHLTCLKSVKNVLRFPMEVQMQILRKVDHDEQWLNLLIDLLYKVGEKGEYTKELVGMLIETIDASRRLDALYRKVAVRCPGKPGVSAWTYEGFRHSWLDRFLRGKMNVRGYGFHTVTHRQPKRPTRSYHRRPYDGLQVVFTGHDGATVILKVLPVGYDRCDTKGVDSFYRGVEVIVPPRPDETEPVYDSGRTRIYADVQVYRSLRQFPHERN